MLRKYIYLILAMCSTPCLSDQATFAGGCFWCVEQVFAEVDGVIDAISGYSGGFTTSPTYEQVSSGQTGHVEVVQVTYDPNKISYEQLLELFWHNIDPTFANGQFCDIGKQYRSVIYYHNDEQKKLAESSKKKLIDSKVLPNVYTEISKFTVFYPAEEYHQNYYKKNPLRYNYYKFRCGRQQRLQEIWGSK